MRTVVVSNRMTLRRSGSVQAGGVAVAIEAVLANCSGLWMGWSGALVEGDKPGFHQEEDRKHSYVTVDWPRVIFSGYYDGFSNQVLWPLFHGRHDLVQCSLSDWSHYRRINSVFAAELARHVRPNDVIWIHDYHLIPLGEALRARGVGNRIGFFLHIPFPDPESFRTLPMHRSLGRALLAYDLVGFQTASDLNHCLNYLRCAYGPTWPSRCNWGAFPVGIATREFEATSANAELSDGPLGKVFAQLPPRVRPVIGVDRLDYSKGLPVRLAAYEGFLSRCPEYRSTTTIVQVAPTSRMNIPAYRQEAARVERLTSEINQSFAQDGFSPVNLITSAANRIDLAAAYRRSPVALVTPLRDGMNLVAKEYVAAQNPESPGVLVLSRTAGAAEELTGALLVDAANPREIAERLKQALEMPLGERRGRWRSMMETLRRKDTAHWASSFLDALVQTSVQGAARTPRCAFTRGASIVGTARTGGRCAAYGISRTNGLHVAEPLPDGGAGGTCRSQPVLDQRLGPGGADPDYIEKCPAVTVRRPGCRPSARRSTPR